MTTGTQQIALAYILTAFIVISGCVTHGPGSPPPSRIVDVANTSWSGRWISPSAYEHYIEARVHHEGGRIDAALANIELALVFDEASPYLNAYFAELLSVKGEPERARAILDKAFVLDAENAFAYFVSAQIAARAGEFELAEAMASLALKLDPDLIRTSQALIEISLKLEKDEEASSLLDEHIMRWPEDPWARLYSGKLAQERGEHDAAIGHFDALNRLRPRLMTGYLHLGAAYQRANRTEDAYNTYTACTESHGLDPDCWLRRLSASQALVEEGFHAQATLNLDVTLMAETLAYSPEQAQFIADKLLGANNYVILKRFVTHSASRHPELRSLYYYLGVSHLRRYERPQAVEAFGQVPPGSDNFLESRAKMSIALSEQGRHSQALSALELALKEDLEVAELWSLRAALYERANRHREALETLQQAFDKFPERPEFLYRFANVALRLNLNKQAQDALERKLKITPDDVEALNLLGRILSERGDDVERAEALIVHAMSLSKVPNGMLSDTLGGIYLSKGRVLEAITHLKVAVELIPGKGDVLERLGDAYSANVEPDRAATLYKQALEVSRSRETLIRIRRKLRNLNTGR